MDEIQTPTVPLPETDTSQEQMMIDIIPNVSSVGIPYYEQYLGYWAMCDSAFCGLANYAAAMDVRSHIAQARDMQQKRHVSQELTIIDGTAIISLQGTLMKHVSSLSNGTSTILARQEINDAAQNKDVEAIILHIDSPGGTAAGTSDLAATVAKAAKKKIVYSYIADMGASAAYWVAAQSSKVFSNSTAMVGGIGTFGVVHDMSGLAAREGIKVHVVKAGEFKGAGVPGTEITTDQLAEQQRIVNDLNAEFVHGVAAGRQMNIEAVQEIADGRVHVGKAAAQLGFTDGVKTFEQVLNLLTKEKSRRETMSTSLYELIKAACVGADNDFICDQLDRNHTVDQAREDWMVEQQLRIEEQKKELESWSQREKELTAASEARATVTGVEPLEETHESTHAYTDALTEWNELIDKHVGRGMNRMRASAAANRENPELRKRVVEEANS